MFIFVFLGTIIPLIDWIMMTDCERRRIWIQFFMGSFLFLFVHLLAVVLIRGIVILLRELDLVFEIVK